jgi:hypothetical protein
LYSKDHVFVAEPLADVNGGVAVEPLYARVNKRTTVRQTSQGTLQLGEPPENIYAFCDKVRHTVSKIFLPYEQFLVVA